MSQALFCYNHLAVSDTTDDRFVASVDAVAFAAWLFVTVCQVQRQPLPRPSPLLLSTHLSCYARTPFAISSRLLSEIPL